MPNDATSNDGRSVVHVGPKMPESTLSAEPYDGLFRPSQML